MVAGAEAAGKVVMANRSQHTFSKRQRERKKAEKAAQKRARRAERANPSVPLSESTEDPPPVGEDDVAAPE